MTSDDKVIVSVVGFVCLTFIVSVVSINLSQAIVAQEAIKAGLIQDEKGHWVQPIPKIAEVNDENNL